MSKVVKFSVSNFEVYNKEGELLCEIDDVKYETDVIGADGEYKVSLITALDHPEITDYLFKNQQLVSVVRRCRLRDIDTYKDYMRTENFDALITKFYRNSVMDDVTTYRICFIIITKGKEEDAEKKY
jgi:hypothetical protein